MGKEGKGMTSKEKEEFEGGRRRERDRGSKGLVGGLISFFFFFSFFVFRIRSVAGILLISVLVFISICNKESF